MAPETGQRDLGPEMRRSQDGDRRAYERLLGELAEIVRARARRRGVGSDMVDDVVQETLLSVHRARHTYDPARPFLPWLHAIADRRIADAFRRRGRLRESPYDATRHDVPTPADDLSVDAAVAEVRRAVAELPGRQREVVELLKLEELSVREVSSRTGMSPSAVKVTAHRGYLRLRQRLRGWFGGR